MQNKPNFLNNQMNINPAMTKPNGNFHLLGRRKNKPNSNPIQTQNKANSKPIKPNFNTRPLLLTSRNNTEITGSISSYVHNIIADFNRQSKILGTVPVAQLDRALASGARGCAFESHRGYWLRRCYKGLHGWLF